MEDDGGLDHHMWRKVEVETNLDELESMPASNGAKDTRIHWFW